MTEDNESISAMDLIGALEAVLKEMRRRHGDGFPVSDEYFWEISTDQLYDPTTIPTDMTIGQLSESLEHVRRLSSGEGEPITYSLVWIADILRAIGQRLT